MVHLCDEGGQRVEDTQKAVFSECALIGWLYVQDFYVQICQYGINYLPTYHFHEHAFKSSLTKSV